MDPEDRDTPAPDSGGWTQTRRRAEQSQSMAVFTDALRLPTGGSAREGAISDLAAYYQLSPEQVIHRCLHWEDESVQEWQASKRDTAEGLAEFYNSVASWSFDLLWYSYLQTLGFAYPKHVVLADVLQRPESGGRLLDFGSGVGVTAQLFAALGYDVTLADVSASLLAFARWRLDRRGLHATYIHLPAELPAASYDFITAVDTFAHVPDAGEAARELYRATRPGGHLAANFDVRRPSERNAWHLYHDDLPLRWAIERAGYVPVRHIDHRIWLYQARPNTGTAWRIRKAWAWLRLASPPVRGMRVLRHALAGAALATLGRRRARRAAATGS